MSRLFGTDGIRGEAGRFPLDPATVRVIGRVLTQQLAMSLDGRAPRIVTGRDTRESSEWIERALIEGATHAGAECESAGVIPTPGVARMAQEITADAGVVISASHNPFRDNGIKIFSSSGRKLDDITERLIEGSLESESLRNNLIDNSTRIVVQSESPGDDESALDRNHAAGLLRRYREYLTEEIARGLELTGLTVVVDCANGAASHLAPPIFESLGARVIPINNSPNGRNINLDCGSLHLEGLQKRVVSERADLGVAFDGDADRALFIDASGRFVDGDATLWVMAKYLSSNGRLANETVVATVMSNIGLEIALRSRGMTLLRTDVGDKYVLEKLLETGSSLGGEQSGHIIFPNLSLVGDGIITTICLLRGMRDTQASLGSLVEGFTRYPQVLVNVPVREKPPFADVKSIAQAARQVEVELGGNGRLLLRYSGTEPLARVMIEGQRMEVIERKANAIADVIREALGTS